ncbi:MAG: alpha/beta fold hydrolase [Salinisphaera sp.]|nr:alpha/beta fold hydrolase [Salinisphaera sp.]
MANPSIASLESRPAKRRLPAAVSVLGRRLRMQIDWLDVDGVRIRYGLRRGRGRPMLLLNTIGGNMDMLLPLVNALDGIELITLDVPGAGHSPSLSIPRGFKWHAWLIVTMLDRLGYDEPINVTGMAWGGLLAQQFALDYPQRVNRLVLAATSTGIASMPGRHSPWRRLQTARRYRRRDTLIERVPALYGGLMRQRPELIERRGEEAIGPSTRGYINQLLSGIAWTSVHRLHGLRCPTLIMGGDDDPVTPLVNIRLLYWLIPKSYLHVVRGGGHLFLLIRANESAAVIKRFINERRYDGTDGQDYFAARNLPPDGALIPRTLAE